MRDIIQLAAQSTRGKYSMAQPPAGRMQLVATRERGE